MLRVDTLPGTSMHPDFRVRFRLSDNQSIQSLVDENALASCKS
jgi:hypothetical protein